MVGPVVCTYDNCELSFSTEKEMRRHKRDNPKHDYCYKCDVDCKDYDDLTQHKVELMAPWLEGKMKHRTDISPAHICCEFCGADFKTFSGRATHRRQAHPAAQDITCPGCLAKFTSAGSTVDHLEQGRCVAISRWEFLGNIQQKYVIRQMMENPAAMADNLRRNQLPYNQVPGMIKDKEESEHEEDTGPDGGVALNVLDMEDDAQRGGIEPLEAEKDLIDMHSTGEDLSSGLGGGIALASGYDHNWPSLSHRMENMSIASKSDAMNTLALGSACSNQTTKSHETAKHGHQARTYHDSSFLTSPTLSNRFDDTSTQSFKHSSSPAPVDTPLPWTDPRGASKALCPTAKPTPPAPRSILKQPAECQTVVEADKKTNLFHSRFWDPASAEWNAEVFFNAAIGMYSCPFPGCDGDDFKEPVEMEHHIMFAHAKTDFVCPSCLKRFNRAAALVSHCESTMKCRVADTRDYKKLIDEITGGFLTSKRLREPKIVRPENALVKAGEAPVVGIMQQKWKTKMPNE